MKLSENKIKRLLEEKIGLETIYIDETVWKRVIASRILCCQLGGIDEYYKRVVNSSVEFQELVEALVIPETWFFRDRESLIFLSEYLSKRTQKNLKILSLPCASGEEPYSIAMMLVDRGFSLSSTQIDAIDISKKAIAQAKVGVYEPYSFRGDDLDFQTRYFSKSMQGYVLDEEIKKCVKFSYGNIFNLVLKRHSYHVIFCRNLLIYLNEKAKQKALNILSELLMPHGVLIVAPSELEQARHAGFVLLDRIDACAFVRESKAGAIAQNKLKPHKIRIPQILDQGATSSLWQIEKAPPKLKEAYVLANQGSYDQAMKLCDVYLSTHQTDPEAFFLKGVIEQARGNLTTAEENFLKGVYLKPNYYEALVYLGLLAEMNGNEKQADLYRQRADKCK